MCWQGSPLVSQSGQKKIPQKIVKHLGLQFEEYGLWPEVSIQHYTISRDGHTNIQKNGQKMLPLMKA